MKTRDNTIRFVIARILPWLALAILLTYSYAKFFRHSYGFRIDSSTGRVAVVFEKQAEPTLREKDRIITIGDVAWEEFQSDLGLPFFKGYQPGDTVPITVERDGQRIEMLWQYPAFSRGEFLDQLNSEWWVAYFFWVAGVLTLLLIRPKDTAWLLMLLFDFLTAILLIAGSGLSTYHIWESAIVLRVAVWLCLPVYWHLHWEFPRPLGRLPSWLVGTIYGISVFFAVLQGVQLLPSDLFLLGFAIALVGSFLLLLIHIWRQPVIRRDFRLPLIFLLLGVVPAMLWVALESSVGIPASYGGVGILSLAFFPFAYFYAAFRRRLGNLELRVNRFFTVILFALLLGIFGMPLIALADYLITIQNDALLLSVAAAVATTIACLWGYPVFESFMDRFILGIPLTSKRLLEHFSTRITTSVSLAGLTHVLQEEVFSSLLIRQFAFLQHDQGSLTVLATMGVAPAQLPEERYIPNLLARTGIFRPPEPGETGHPYSWIRLVLPLKLGDELIGFWLLGRRDPDDLYSQQEIPVLSSLANLASIALSNILQTERLRSMYESNIGRYEQERLRLSRELHDSILNEMAALLMRSDSPVLSKDFQQAFEELTERLREIVGGLRPPTLTFGLKYALDELAEKLSERSQNSMKIETRIQVDGEWRYPEIVEHHAYRIAQEACENALRYAHAKAITITAKLMQKSLDIQVEDDGIGFQIETNRKLTEMLAHKHFGLVGMLERATLIGAEIDIESKPGEGTCIRLRWKLREAL